MGPAVFARRCVDGGLDYVGVDLSPIMVQRALALGLNGVHSVDPDHHRPCG
jgi:hypothetical protein